MQFKFPACTWNDSCANDTFTTACPDTRQCDRKCCDDTTPAPTTATTTCQPKTSEWPSPPSRSPSCCDCDDTNDAEGCVAEDCDAPRYLSPQRSSRLFSPVFPTKVKPRKKRQKRTAGTTKPITSTKEDRGKRQQNDENTSAGPSAGIDGSKPTASKLSPTTKKTDGVAATATTNKNTNTNTNTVNTTTKSKSPLSPSSPSKAATKKPTGTPTKSPSSEIFYLKRRSNKKPIIDWKKPPKIPIKHTVTSKARNENWFADCGKYRVKAYRGDWDNLPDELSADYELYERFFKHRKPVVKKNTSLVKKLVEGKIDLQKPRIDNKPFRKRSPVLPPAGEKPKRRSKLKSSSFRFGVRGFRFNLRKQPLIQVRQTLTSSMRRDLDGHSCEKAQTPTYWHGSVEEMEQLKKKIDQRRGQLRNYWKKTGDQQNRQQRRHHHHQPKSQPHQQKQRQTTCTDSMNNLMIASSNPSIILESESKSKTKTKRLQTAARTRKSDNESANVVEYRKSKDILSPRLTKPTVEDIQNFHKAIVIKVLPASQSLLVSGHAHKPRTIINVLSKDHDASETAKWMQPPTIPIRHSMTSIMRQKSTNKFSRNTLKAHPKVCRVAR